jgi:hypothetical protein
MPLPEQEESGVATPASPKMDFGNILLHIGNIMSATSAGMQGRPYNPSSILETRLRDQLAQRESKRQDEELGLRKQQLDQAKNRERFGKVEKVLDLAFKAGIEDGEVATRLLRTVIEDDPDLKTTFGAHIDSFRVNPKSKEIDRDDYEAKDGELFDPVDKKPLPAGRYDVKGKIVNGQFVPTQLAPSKAAAAEARELKRDEESRAREAARDERETKRQTAIDERFDKRMTQQDERFNKSQANISARQDKMIGAIMNKPADASTQKDISQLYGVLRQVDNIRGNFDKEYLGPVKGTDTAFETRRRIGSYIGSPVGEKEVTFRQSLKDISDQLLRARSGAAINEAEYERMIGILPKATDEPKVFEAGVKRFEDEMKALLDSRVNLSRTSRKDLSGAPAGAAIGAGVATKGGWSIRPK